MTLTPYTDDDGYQIDRYGRIQSPGQFEGERRYLPTFWGIYLEGLADEQPGGVVSVVVEAPDKREFPELTRRRRVRMVQTEQGFVCEV